MRDVMSSKTPILVFALSWQARLYLRHAVERCWQHMSRAPCRVCRLRSRLRVAGGALVLLICASKHEYTRGAAAGAIREQQCARTAQQLSALNMPRQTSPEERHALFFHTIYCYMSSRYAAKMITAKRVMPSTPHDQESRAQPRARRHRCHALRDER